MKKSQLVITLCLSLVIAVFAGCSSSTEAESRPDDVREEQWEGLKRYTILTNDYIKSSLPNARNDYEDGITEDSARAFSVIQNQPRGGLWVIEDDFTDAEVELRQKVMQLGHEIIVALNQRHEITEEIEERYAGEYEELKEYFGIDEPTEEVVLEELYSRFTNADELITDTLENYLTALEEGDFSTAYHFLSINKSEDEYVKDMESFYFLNDYQLNEYSIFSIDERGVTNFAARVGLRSTSIHGEDASILIMPLRWSADKNMWIIDSERIKEE